MQLKINILPQLKQWFIEKSNLITSWSSTASDTKVASEKLVKTELDKKAVKTDVDTALATKIDKSSIKTSVTSSLTNNDVIGGKALYDRISEVEAGIPEGMEHTDITDWDTAVSGFEKSSNKVTSIRSSGATDTAYPTEKAVKSALDTAKTTADSNYAAKSHTHTTSNITNWSTATSGFESNSNKATSLTNASDTTYPTTKAVNTALSSAKTTADSNYAAKSHTHTSSNISNWSTATSGFQTTSNLETSISTSTSKYPSSSAVNNALNNKLNTSQKVTSLDENSTDNNVPSAKAVYDLYAGIPKWDVQRIDSVDSLPTTGVYGTIYLVSNGGSGKNQYDEYFWNDKGDIPGYEKFDGLEIDISNLVTMDEVIEYIGNNGSLSLDSEGNLSLTIN